MTLLRSSAGWGQRLAAGLLSAMTLLVAAPAFASEADLKIPPLDQVMFLAGSDGVGGINGRMLLMLGLLVCFGGLGLRHVHVREAPEPAGPRERCSRSPS